MKSLLIFSSFVSERLTFILDFFWGENYKLTNSISEFEQYPSAKICYSNDKISNEAYWINPCDLLQKNTLENHTIQTSRWEGLSIFFQKAGDLPFDIFAASFYLITRYEEYLSKEVDQYGRFPEKNSLAYREGFLQLPLVDMWMQRLENILKNKFEDYKPKEKAFQYTPTFDIDVPFAFLHKPIYVQIGAFFKNIFKCDFPLLKKQIQTWAKKTQDPFDNFALLGTQMHQYNFAPIYFFPVAKKHGRFDKNPPQSNSFFQELIRSTSKKNTIGIHPSWQSGDDQTKLLQEKDFLEKTTHQKITKSRQHYLRMTLPETYQTLIDIGIEDDFTMGYGNIDGFRASTSRSFYWFDLVNNKATKLRIHPFCWMDATAYHHTKESLEQVLEKLQYYYQLLQPLGGTMITIMHNNYFAETPDTLPFRNAMLDFWKESFSSNSKQQKI